MARYSNFLNRKVQVQYRAGDVILPASGTFVADSGRSIFLEQRSVQRGQTRHFRWEIPYQYIVRLRDLVEPVSTDSTVLTEPSADRVTHASEAVSPDDSRKSRAASAVGGGASFLNPINRSKTI